MTNLSKFYQKTWQQRLQALIDQKIISDQQRKILQCSASDPELGDQQIENYLTHYNLPEGLALHYIINGKRYLIPMVTEEPSVIAASSHGAAIIEKSGGFTTKVSGHLLWGQIVFEKVSQPEKLKKNLEEQQEKLILIANQAHPSLQKRGGGARHLRVRILAADLVSLDLAIDTQEAMGANMVNSMLEAVANYLGTQISAPVLLSVLSNLADESLAQASCRIPVEFLTRPQLAGQQVAEKIAVASRLAQLDPYRAATHNKGIMNGVDAVAIAMGNDWRAIESAAHAFAVKSGSYRGLSQWQLNSDNSILEGKITLPLPVAVVGGSIKIVPLVQLNQQLAKINSATQLAEIIVSVGLAQNLAALQALVSEGIQQGHMRLQLRATILAAGAQPNEVATILKQMQQMKKTDLTTAQSLLAKKHESEH
ncbi:hydroxymethylglutaryl-CoA reductase, degradative [Liquorilactobacillus nagelii]|uniref:hydroxymethylglutaryl-CoA reductase, degradative n=1 Tax=Liquorilactobacillus nagelii TaxID=82688 RepID=UPI001CC9E436|nr:hydroxymethylglutaryl-CoA reductase, degradative [Liquorilactobacillus nagelii]ULQ49232.1 hydroxymethylglutaryl-CoA reductase, degradative [Liquorilactobacillus nagelii]